MEGAEGDAAAKKAVVRVDGKEFPFPEEFTPREWGYIKRFANVLPRTFAQALRDGDQELIVAIGVIVKRRAGDPVDEDELLDAPVGTITAEEVKEPASE